jgi:ribosomal protein S18 acetylase RimI-like enzyme
LIVVEAVVRPASPGDARAIAEVHVGSWRWAYRGQLPDEVLNGLSVDEREVGWRDILADASTAVLVAERDRAIVGFASGGASTDDGAGEDIGEVYAIYVAEEVASAGVGAALFSQIRAAMADQGFEVGTLWVLESNERARRFYERQGWEWDGSRSDHQVQCANRPIVRYAGPLI